MSRVPVRLVALAAGALAVLATGVFLVVRSDGAAPVPTEVASGAPSATARATAALQFRRLQDPPRTEVLGGDGSTVAVFTDTSRTVRLTGPERVFAEPKYTPATVRTDQWIRLAPHPWSAGQETQPWFAPWLKSATADRTPDVLGVAMEYGYGAQPLTDPTGQQIAGDAAFGPLSDADPDGRAENSDFYDYLGVPWSFPDGKKEQPDPERIHSLDCSGFIRMVYGYRLGLPLRGTNTPGEGALPRRAYAMAEFGPGQIVIPNSGTQARDFDKLQPGDLLFFHTASAEGASIEHMGIYLGIDDAGHQRFISSRTKANGPTLGDAGGESILDGTGYWAVRFRTARRV
ncbi:hypothetical protein Lfu02_59200 [Longispora fulva]|uniref:Cell wall-associated NlpC family hydrolase n=1 Tax=Longispora fulva TaxID=619741 RepID=A0A8J7GRY0_9ACTN|nr:NlpC/P60 family protein [Longispora fulva]MBG6137098.1 cell wall-associated NlpC family hydrolase [Longispora fulva]GIG61548.1 hypothetical protein Lfu02_59200 [Longispora fulva]